MATIPITKTGAEKLKQELHTLKSVDRPAVINAITDAVGHEDVPMPATPLAVWQACQKGARKLAAE